MANPYNIPQAKLLYFAALLQYLYFAVMYCIESAKLRDQEYDRQRKEEYEMQVRNQSIQAEGGSDEEQKKTDEDKEDPVDLEEVKMEEADNSEKKDDEAD